MQTEYKPAQLRFFHYVTIDASIATMMSNVETLMAIDSMSSAEGLVRTMIEHVFLLSVDAIYLTNHL